MARLPPAQKVKAENARKGMRVARNASGLPPSAMSHPIHPQRGVIHHDPTTTDLWANRIPILLDGAKNYRWFHAIQWDPEP